MRGRAELRRNHVEIWGFFFLGNGNVEEEEQGREVIAASWGFTWEEVMTDDYEVRLEANI